MTKRTFHCIDSHTCGNPVRMVISGAPQLRGETMLARREDFLQNHDWIRRALMFEPRGHDAMSGTILYPPTRPDCDVGVLFIEVSGCLPMCGHGTIGTVTSIIEQGLVEPREPGFLSLDTPAGLVRAQYFMKDGHVDRVRLTNVPAFVHATGLEVDLDGMGTVRFDVSYGGNFYAIVEPQENFQGLETLSVADILHYSPRLRALANEQYSVVHPVHDKIRGVSHVMWIGKPTQPGADSRNAVFFGERGIDRSPCGTGTSARVAQLVARGDLEMGKPFVNESIIGTCFTGIAQERTDLLGRPGIVPTVEGWARVTGTNLITVDTRDPLAHGFQLS